MKLELDESDREVLFSRAVEGIDRITREMVTVEMRGVIHTAMLKSLQKAVQEHVDAFLPTMVLPDGRTVQKYIEDSLSRRNKGQVEERQMRSRIEEMIDNRIYHESNRIFKDVLEPIAAELRTALTENISRMLFHQAAKG